MDMGHVFSRALTSDIAFPNPMIANQGQRILRIITDVRIYVNTIGQLVNEMRKIGLDVKMNQVQDADSVTITLLIPKRRQKAKLNKA